MLVYAYYNEDDTAEIAQIIYISFGKPDLFLNDLQMKFLMDEKKLSALFRNSEI